MKIIFYLVFAIPLAVIALVAALFWPEIKNAVTLAWSQLHDWMISQKVGSTDYAEMVKRSIEGGKVKVVSNVFTSAGVIRASRTDEGLLDGSLEQRFGGQDRITVPL